MIKVLVIGIDGATWKVVKPLIKKNELPNIARFVRGGTSGDLESSVPTATFPAWRCYSTGKNPGKLGVYSFLDVDVKNKTVSPNNSLSFKSKDIWDYLGSRGIACGVINLPGTYPVKEINGFMIAHSLIECSGFTYPPELEDELRVKFGYRITPVYLYHDDRDKCIDEIKKIIQSRVRVAEYLINKFNPSFLHITFFYTDHIQHFFWGYMENNDAKYGSVIRDIWVEVDKGIGKIFRRFVDKNTYVFVMGDHGFTKVKGEFALGKWLIEKKYMKLNRRWLLINAISKFGFNIESIVNIAKKFGIYHIARKKIPQHLLLKLYGLLPSKKGVTVASRGTYIDWNRSKVLLLQGIYINRNLINDKDYEQFREQLIEELRNIKNPETGERLYRDVYKKEQILNGPYLDKAPDILTVTNGYVVRPKYNTKKLWEFSNLEATGHHELNSIFIAYGPDIKKGYKIEGAKIYDIAPTILHIFGLPIPNDMDGRVLMEIFEEDSELARKEPVYVDPSYYDQKDERERLKAKIKELKFRGRI